MTNASRRRWPKLAAGVSSIALLLGGTPTQGQGPSAAAVDEAAAARASYGLPAGRSHVRELLTVTDNVASEQFGFPLTRREHADLLARSAYARRFQARTLPYVARLEGFGGAWLDHEDGGRIVVGLTAVTDRARRQVRARLPKVNRGVRFAVVDDSAAELARALRRADRDWASLGSGILPQAFGVSYRHNRLVVRVLPRQLATARRFVSRMSRLAGVDVAVEASARVTDSSCGSRFKCYAPLRLGTRINHRSVYRSRAPRRQWNCAIGFMLSDRSILTAGHCTHRHAGPWHGHAEYRSRFGAIGNRKASLYTSQHRDLARITLEDWRANRTARIYGDTRPTYLTQPGEVLENMVVCASLARQDRFWCGRVTEPVARWRSSTAGIWVWGAGMRFDVRGRTSLPGDSGSPVVARVKECETCADLRVPIGIVNAGNEADARARTVDGRPIDADLYFAKVSWALQNRNGWRGLKIYTGPTPPPSPTPTISPQPTEPAEPGSSG